MAPQIFPKVKVIGKVRTERIEIGEDISLVKLKNNEVVIEWVSSERNDIIGDCMGYLLYELNQYDDLDMFRHDPYDPDRKTENYDSQIRLLKENFGEKFIIESQNMVLIREGEEILAEVQLNPVNVLSAKNEIVRRRIEGLLAH